jgi:signal transduction histidine kinase
VGNTAGCLGHQQEHAIASFCGPLEFRLSELNPFQKQLLECLPVAICSCDVHGLLIEYNRHAVELWGREPQIGARFCGAPRLFDSRGKLVDERNTPVARVLKSGLEQRNTELIIERPDGKRINVLSNAAPLLNTQGHIVGALEVFQDITERRWSEEARRVADRLAASARVASAVAQQMKKPLLSLSSLLQVLRQDANLSAEARSYTELIQQELLRFDNLAKEMVHLSMAA